MIVKEIRDEDFTSYKKPSMVVGFPRCNWKCGKGLCQNSPLATAPDIEIHEEEITRRYLFNPITKAVIMAGLEPFNSPRELLDLIDTIRKYTDDDIVIYTGFTKEEVQSMSYTVHGMFCSIEYSYLGLIAKHPNIIIKFGRFIPDQQPHYDEVLGIKLASDNQYAERIS
jgi:hypothetical protein